jgi:heme exporter protein B
MRVLAELIIKDLRLEGRRKDLLTAVFLFSLVMTLILSIAIPSTLLPEGPIGAFWVTVLFTSTFPFTRAFSREKDTGTLESLLLLPADRGILFLSKVGSNFVLFAFILVVTGFFVVVLFNFPVTPELAYVLGLGLIAGLGIVVAGSFIGALTVHARGREILLFVLLFPFLIPLFLAAVNASLALYQAAETAPLKSWALVFAFFDLFMFAVMYLLFEWVIME